MDAVVRYLLSVVLHASTSVGKCTLSGFTGFAHALCRFAVVKWRICWPDVAHCLPSHTSHKERRERVEKVIQELGLEACANSKVQIIVTELPSVPILAGDSQFFNITPTWTPNF